MSDIYNIGWVILVSLVKCHFFLLKVNEILMSSIGKVCSFENPGRGSPNSLVLPKLTPLKSILYSLVVFLRVHSASPGVPSKHHSCGCGSLHLFFAELWNGLHSLQLKRVSCITNTHLFPSAHFREHLCLLLACLGTMKPNKVGLGRTSWDHLIHYPFPKAYRVNNGTTSLQTPAARL